MSEKENLRRYISELIQEVEKELEEATTTGNVDGYQTPHAFSRKKDKERTRKNATQLGYELVDDDVDNISEAMKKITPSQFKKLEDVVKKVNPKIKISPKSDAPGGFEIKIPDDNKWELHTTKVQQLIQKITGDPRNGRIFFEGKDFKRVKKDKYGNHLEPQFKKGDKVKYLGNKAVITRVNRESSGVYSYDVDYYKGNGRTKASNIFNKDGKTIQLESVNEAGLKGTENIPSNKKLSKLSDNEKLNILQSGGNIISFHIPDWAKGRYKMWQVISAGKIKKQKDLDGEIIYFLPGKGPQKASPTYKSVKDLINGVDWETMEMRRESVNEATDDKQKVVDYLVKKGNNKNDAQKMVDKNYDYVSKKYKGASVSKKAEIISGLQESVNEEKLKPKKLTQLKKGEKFVFNNTPYEFVELYTDISNAAKVKKEDGKTSVVSFGGGVVNKNTKGGFSDYLKQGGRVWDNVNPSDSSSVNEAKIKRPVNRWLELKNDDTMHPHKKMAHGLKELKYQLAETEKFFTWYNKIKTMNELDSTNYWKRTQNHIYKIKERLINIAKTLQEIEK